MFSTVLIANRGEIAVRITRTLRRLGVRAVAIYTGADEGARHVREADLALRVRSYLDAEDILSVAHESGAEAIHPGYGFLAENAGFARLVPAERARVHRPAAGGHRQDGRQDRGQAGGRGRRRPGRARA